MTGSRFRGLGRHGVVLFGLMGAALVWAALWVGAGTLLHELEERFSDLAWTLTAERQTERRLIVVDIDERSLREVGPWPWPRPVQARLIEQIALAGARQQILDIVFSDPSPGDQTLADVVRKQRPVLAQVFSMTPGDETRSGELAGALDWVGCPPPFAEATGYVANFGALKPASAGHITPRVSRDGLVRQLPAVICYQGRSYPALGIAGLMQGAGVHQLVLERGTGWLDPAWRLGTSPAVSEPIPLNERGDLRVSWRRHPDGFISLSAADVLAGQIPADVLRNAWVLVGSSAFGLNDSIATPFSGAGSGLQVHLQVVTALIDGRTPYTPRGEWVLQVVAGALGVLLLLALRPRSGLDFGQGRGRRFPVYLLPLVATGWGVLLWVAHASMLVSQALWVGWLSPALFTVLAGSAVGILDHARSRFDREQLFTHLSSYLPAPVAAALALQPPSSAITASTQQVSVLFADIRNFSAYCEARPPEEAAAVLHAFFSTATRVVAEHGGVIEAFQGDAVMAVWGGPAGQEPYASGGAPSHAQRSLEAAVHMLAAMQGVLPDPAPGGLEPLSLGIGIETGLAMTGSFGLASRRTHMVLGRTVTIASRLVEMTGELAHPIVVGEGLAGQVGGTGLESMGTFLLEGLRVPHHIYAYPLSADTPQP